MRKKIIVGLAAGAALILAGAILYQVPFIHDRLSWRIDAIQSNIKYALFPPEDVVFVPQGNSSNLNSDIATVVAATLNALTPTVTPTMTVSAPSAISATPTITPTPIPNAVDLPGVVYIDQHNRWNYCGPANLAMALTYWGWDGTRDDIAEVVKPGIEDDSMSFIDRGKTDKNVMPYELVDYVNDDTQYQAISRFGGDEDLLKRLIAAGYPVLIEKGYYERDYNGKISWMGHYLFVTGYDDNQQSFIVQDAYLTTGADGTGKDLLSDYPTFQEGWRSFNYLFMLVYPADRETAVMNLLGQWADESWANQHALEIANQETGETTGNDLFFAWFNKGTSHVQLTQYSDAAAAFDQAFQVYAGLGDDEKQRPYRIMWYQTWPYWAYFYSGRYQDVVDLADTTLNDTIDKPTLEESLYWRAMGEWALGDLDSAIADFKMAVYYNPNFSSASAKLTELGVQP